MQVIFGDVKNDQTIEVHADAAMPVTPSFIWTFASQSNQGLHQARKLKISE